MAHDSVSDTTATLEAKYNELMYLGTNMCEILTNLNTVVEGLVKIANRYESLVKDINGMTKK